MQLDLNDFARNNPIKVLNVIFTEFTNIFKLKGG